MTKEECIDEPEKEEIENMHVKKQLFMKQAKKILQKAR